MIHLSIKVEYLVVSVDDDTRKVRLSLAQEEILESLAQDEALFKTGAKVPGMSSDQYVLKHIRTPQFSTNSRGLVMVKSYLLSTLSLEDLCWRQRQDVHGAYTFGTYLKLSRI